MKFKEEVELLLKNAGWFENRDIKSEYDTLTGFDELPSFLKEFLYKYGNLKITTHKYDPSEVNATLDLSIHKRLSKSNQLKRDGSFYSIPNLYTIGYYDLDNASCVCDDEGQVYMLSDAPTLMSSDFKEGIEKILMEDYSNTKEWHYDVEEWKEDEY